MNKISMVLLISILVSALCSACTNQSTSLLEQTDSVLPAPNISIDGEKITGGGSGQDEHSLTNADNGSGFLETSTVTENSTSNENALDTITNAARDAANEPSPIGALHESAFNTDFPSGADAISALQQLCDKTVEYASVDYDAFSALYRNTPDETIQYWFTNDYTYNDRFDQMNYTIVYARDGHYIIGRVLYIVAGTHPNTHTEYFTTIYSISYEDGVWKFDNDRSKMTCANEYLTRTSSVLPEGLCEADSAGRNACIFNGDNYMYINSGNCFKGCSHSEVKFAWQDETGNLFVVFWLANGTGSNLYYTTCELSLTSETLGTIVNGKGDLNTVLKAYSSGLVTIEIPAANVSTGTDVWGTVSYHISTHF